MLLTHLHTFRTDLPSIRCHPRKSHFTQAPGATTSHYPNASATIEYFSFHELHINGQCLQFRRAGQESLLAVTFQVKSLSILPDTSLDTVTTTPRCSSGILLQRRDRLMQFGPRLLCCEDLHNVTTSTKHDGIKPTLISSLQFACSTRHLPPVTPSAADCTVGRPRPFKKRGVFIEAHSVLPAQSLGSVALDRLVCLALARLSKPSGRASRSVPCMKHKSPPLRNHRWIPRLRTTRSLSRKVISVFCIVTRRRHKLNADATETRHLGRRSGKPSGCLIPRTSSPGGRSMCLAA